TGWSAPWATGGTWLVAADAAATGGKILRYSTATPGRAFLAWDSIDADPDRGDVEILFKWRAATESTSFADAIVRGGGGAGTETGYRGARAGSGSSDGLSRYVGGAYIVIGGAADSVFISKPNWYIS